MKQLTKVTSGQTLAKVNSQFSSHIFFKLTPSQNAFLLRLPGEDTHLFLFPYHWFDLSLVGPGRLCPSFLKPGDLLWPQSFKKPPYANDSQNSILIFLLSSRFHFQWPVPYLPLLVSNLPWPTHNP